MLCIDYTTIIINKHNVYATKCGYYWDGGEVEDQIELPLSFIRSGKGNISSQDTLQQVPLCAPFSLCSLTLVIIALTVLINTFSRKRSRLLFHEIAVGDTIIY